jgi:hypothetical protein
VSSGYLPVDMLQNSGGGRFDIFKAEPDVLQFMANAAATYGYALRRNVVRAYAIDGHALQLVNEVRSSRLSWGFAPCIVVAAAQLAAMT